MMTATTLCMIGGGSKQVEIFVLRDLFPSAAKPSHASECRARYFHSHQGPQTTTTKESNRDSDIANESKMLLYQIFKRLTTEPNRAENKHELIGR